MTYIHGVEVTANYNGKKHILAYNFNLKNKKLLSILEHNQLLVSSGLDKDPSLFYSAKEVIESIINAKGIPIIAHPGCGLYNDDFKEYINTMTEFGVQGIECYHPDNNAEVIEYCLKICTDKNLYITGGSDFHGSSHPERQLGCMNIKGKDVNL